MDDATTTVSPPRDNLLRALAVHPELRAADPEDDTASTDEMPTMFGHFAVFNRWTEIDSMFEGRFMESIAPGAFKKTFRENRSNIRSLFQHGLDFQIGDKPLGPIDQLREDDIGGYYEVPLLDARYVREDILPGLQAGLYGASFRFNVTKELINDNPEASEYNPDRLPERTIKELRLYEFGPVTFPAYADATAGVRSLTDDYILRRFARDPQKLGERLGDIIEANLAARAAKAAPALAPVEPPQGTPAEASRSNTAPTNRPVMSLDDFIAALSR